MTLLSARADARPTFEIFMFFVVRHRFSGRVGAVAERFVVGLAAATQRHPVPDFVGLAVGGNDGDAAAYPDGAAHLFGRVFNQAQ